MRQGQYFKLSLIALTLAVGSIAFGQQQQPAATNGIVATPAGQQQVQQGNAPVQQQVAAQGNQYPPQPQYAPNNIPFSYEMLQGDWVADCVHPFIPTPQCLPPSGLDCAANIAQRVKISIQQTGTVIREVDEFRNQFCQGPPVRIAFSEVGRWLPPLPSNSPQFMQPTIGQVTFLYDDATSGAAHPYDNDLAPYDTSNRFIQFYTPNQAFFAMRDRGSGLIIPNLSRMWFRSGYEPTAPHF